LWPKAPTFLSFWPEAAFLLLHRPGPEIHPWIQSSLELDTTRYPSTFTLQAMPSQQILPTGFKAGEELKIAPWMKMQQKNSRWKGGRSGTLHTRLG
jgi:hypothetical protein